jgi:hypothetical protein
MAIRLALTALLCWLFAFAWMTWGQIRVLRARRESDSAALKYTSALVRERIAELTQLNHELDFHMAVLRSSYPRILKASEVNQASNGSSSHRHHAPEVAQVRLQSSQSPPKPVADLLRPTPQQLLR